MSDSFSSFHSATPNSNLNCHAAPKFTTICSIAQPCCICTHCNHLTFNHYVGPVLHNSLQDLKLSFSEQGRNSTVQSQVQSSRWNPTPIQLLVLEELYRHGTKTPSAEQIQQIASQLRQFGKIEGKNVFYWFQNRKARERQKRRRMEMEDNNASAAQGLKETGCRVKETKKWASTSNCSGHAEESAALDVAEKGSSEWTQIEGRGIQVLRRDIAERQTKCQDMEMLCFPPITMAAKTLVASQLSTHTNQNLNLQFVLNRGNSNYYDEEHQDPRTLDLFPHKRDEQDGNICLAEKKSMFCSNASTVDTEITSNQFLEFLPLRN